MPQMVAASTPTNKSEAIRREAAVGVVRRATEIALIKGSSSSVTSASESCHKGNKVAPKIEAATSRRPSGAVSSNYGRVASIGLNANANHDSRMLHNGHGSNVIDIPPTAKIVSTTTSKSEPKSDIPLLEQEYVKPPPLLEIASCRTSTSTFEAAFTPSLTSSASASTTTVFDRDLDQANGDLKNSSLRLSINSGRESTPVKYNLFDEAGNAELLDHDSPWQNQQEIPTANGTVVTITETVAAILEEQVDI